MEIYFRGCLLIVPFPMPSFCFHDYLFLTRLKNKTYLWFFSNSWNGFYNSWLFMIPFFLSLGTMVGKNYSLFWSVCVLCLKYYYSCNCLYFIYFLICLPPPVEEKLLREGACLSWMPGTTNKWWWTFVGRI